MDKIHLKINGQEVEAEPGMTVLEAALAAGIYIPTLCYHPDLEPYGGCRMCIVEIEKMRGMPTACTTKAADGMVVTTNSPALQEIRRDLLNLLLRRFPCECLVCEKRDKCKPDDDCERNVAVSDRCSTCASNGVCEMQKVVDYIGIRELELTRDEGKRTEDSSNPFFNVDHNRCILCSRCVRTCQEITCVGAIDMSYRGHKMKVSAFNDVPLFESICRSCGECMARCPTGALNPKEVVRPEKEVKTTCPYCAVGCQMYLGVSDNKIVGVRGDPAGPSNKGNLCVKGRFGISEFVHHESRLTMPLIKRDGKFEEATWAEALDLVASKFKNYRSDEIGFISSARSTNEANYIMQKFARAVLGTNSVDHCARL
jgi:predicted molibdopterin-dependent oxidoreductase YjgC